MEKSEVSGRKPLAITLSREKAHLSPKKNLQVSSSATLEDTCYGEQSRIFLQFKIFSIKKKKK